MPVRIKVEDHAIDDLHDPMDVEDEIVETIDVFLSPALAEQTYLLQFPLQHSPSQILGARLKPRHGMLELDQALRSNMERQDNKFPMTKRLFHSSTIPIDTHLCLAKVVHHQHPGTGASLHLVPLSHLTQMRPSFRHITETDTEMEVEEDDRFMDKQPIFPSRKESERAAMARKSSYSFKKASEETEAWKNLTIHGVGSSPYVQTMKNVMCPKPKQRVLSSTTQVSQETYIQSFNYLQTTNPTATETESVEVNDNPVKTIVARLTRMMSTGYPLPYSIVHQHVPDANDDTLWKALSVCAVVVRGNLCLHSKFMPLPRELQHARTFLLLLLQREKAVERPRLDHAWGGKSDRLLIVLNQVAKKTTDGWVLKVQEDTILKHHFPNQVALHSGYWTRQAKRFQKELEAYHSNLSEA